MKYSAVLFFILIPALIIAQSIDPLYITLNGDITNPDQEVSGLAWNGDQLVLLPQYPGDVIYAIPKNEILEYLDLKRTVITPTEIIWETNGIEQEIKGFEGFESIAFTGEDVYVTIEAETWNRNCAYILKGIYSDDKIELNKESLRKIYTPVHLRNMTFETILLSEDEVITIYEVNAKNVNKHPIYYTLDKELYRMSKKPFPYTDYRITDATELDDENKFWTINYFWPGDFTLLNPDMDHNINKKGIKPVEQLLEFQLQEESIVRTNAPPIVIKLSEFGDSRNWEGIVRLNDMGFLLVTDKFPGTILAYLPYRN